MFEKNSSVSWIFLFFSKSLLSIHRIVCLCLIELRPIERTRYINQIRNPIGFDWKPGDSRSSRWKGSVRCTLIPRDLQCKFKIHAGSSCHVYILWNPLKYHYLPINAANSIFRHPLYSTLMVRNCLQNLWGVNTKHYFYQKAKYESIKKLARIVTGCCF